MSREFSYFGGKIGANTTTTLQEPSKSDAGGANRGALLTSNAQYMRKAKDTAPETQAVIDLYEASWSHAQDTVQNSWVSTGTVTVSGAPTGSTGRWVWVYRAVDGFVSDFQMNDFDFQVAIGGDADGVLPNDSSLINFFERHSYNSTIDRNSNYDNISEVETQYETKVNDGLFVALANATTNSTYNGLNSAPGSTGTGIDDGSNYFIYYESSGTFTNGKVGLLRSKELTFGSGVSPTIEFSYAVSSTSSTHVGGMKLYWAGET